MRSIRSLTAVFQTLVRAPKRVSPLFHPSTVLPTRFPPERPLRPTTSFPLTHRHSIRLALVLDFCFTHRLQRAVPHTPPPPNPSAPALQSPPTSSSNLLHPFDLTLRPSAAAAAAESDINHLKPRRQTRQDLVTCRPAALLNSSGSCRRVQTLVAAGKKKRSPLSSIRWTRLSPLQYVHCKKKNRP